MLTIFQADDLDGYTVRAAVDGLVQRMHVFKSFTKDSDVPAWGPSRWSRELRGLQVLFLEHAERRSVSKICAGRGLGRGDAADGDSARRTIRGPRHLTTGDAC